jgi:hypothetical protein
MKSWHEPEMAVADLTIQPLKYISSEENANVE